MRKEQQSSQSPPAKAQLMGCLCAALGEEVSSKYVHTSIHVYLRACVCMRMCTHTHPHKFHDIPISVPKGIFIIVRTYENATTGCVLNKPKTGRDRKERYIYFVLCVCLCLRMSVCAWVYVLCLER